jgi:hypothetical protein
MKSVVRFGVGVVGLLAAGGCEPPSTPDGLNREMLGHVLALSASCEKKEPFEKQWELVTKMKATADKYEKLSIPPEERELLRKRYMADFFAAARKFQTAGEALVAADPDPRLRPALNEAVLAIYKFYTP